MLKAVKAFLEARREGPAARRLPAEAAAQRAAVARAEEEIAWLRDLQPGKL